MHRRWIRKCASGLGIGAKFLSACTLVALITATNIGVVGWGSASRALFAVVIAAAVVVAAVVAAVWFGSCWICCGSCSGRAGCRGGGGC